MSSVPDDDEKTLAVPFTARSEGGTERFVLERHGDGARFELAAEAVALLRRANRFRTLEGHLRLMEADGLSSEARARLPELHRRLLAEGLLRTRADALARMAAGPRDPEPPPPITVCAWVTRDRPGTLLRGVESLLRHNREHGREPVYHVYDDSSGPDAQDAARNGLAELARRTGADIRHVGTARKRAWLDLLIREGAREGLPAEVVRFALEPPGDGMFSAGTNRNALMVGTLGELALSSDDDMVFEPRRLAGVAEDGALAFSSAYSPTELWPVADMQSAMTRVHPTGVGLLAAHEALLGQTVSGLLEAVPPEQVHLDGVNPALCARLEQGGGRVLVTSAGSYGDTGMGNPRMLLTLEGPARESVLASEAHYRAVAANHLAVNMATRATVSEGIALLAMNLGFDNRALLPPLVPRFRGQDTILAAVLRRALPLGYLGYLPLGLLHSPAETRRMAPELMHETAPNFGGFMLLLIDPFKAPESGVAFDGDSRGEALRALGRHLLGLGRAPASDFRDFVRERWEHHARAMANHLEALLERYGGKPDFWARDVAAYRANLLASASGGDGPLPRELRQDAAAAWTQLQELVAGYGGLLGAWPELVRAAGRLKAEGQGLADNGQP